MFLRGIFDTILALSLRECIVCQISVHPLYTSFVFFFLAWETSTPIRRGQACKPQLVGVRPRRIVIVGCIIWARGSWYVIVLATRLVSCLQESLEKLMVPIHFQI
ncbi:hypothetical protein RRG08_025614 [Elysia crispata]|uniref:Uncharacterized protein n=1 Tax=Elysia crispata TaxID=231223 RepID=A0AAE0YEM6_9GAST|nr:hypothetical protein RRG08_025614 [Elysia crispata]